MGDILVKAQRALRNISSQIRTLTNDYLEEKEKLQKAFKEQQEIIAQTQVGLDMPKINLALETLECRGELREHGRSELLDNRVRVTEIAITEILKGGGKLWLEYYGTKDYSGFLDQFFSCRYGLVPSHGYSTFSVGLSRTVRQRKYKALTQTEIEACVYYLTNLPRLQEIEAKLNEKPRS